MTQQLRDELVRLAEQAPTFHPDACTWARGRRARRLDRVLAGAAALAVVVALGGIATALAGGPAFIAPATPTDTSPGIPDTLYPVPRHVQLQDNSERFTGPLSPTLAVGRGAIAFVTGNGLPVVVDAETGDYHLLDLPGWRLGDLMTRMWLDPSDSQPLALSPDGRRLAWAYADIVGWVGDAPPMTGVRVVDLATGEVSETQLTGMWGPRGDSSALVRSLVWSPDSDWLGWSGIPVRQWDSGGIGGFGAGRLVGRTDPDHPGTVEASRVAVDTGGIAISDTGVVWDVDQKGAVTPLVGEAGHPGGHFSVAGPLSPAPVGSASPDGSRIALGSFVRSSTLDVLDLDRRRVLHRTLPEDVYADEAIARPLGWIDDDTILVAARTETDDDLGLEHLAVMSAPTVPSDRSSYQVVARSTSSDDASGVASYYSVAVDLMTRARPTVARPEPDWPWSIERKVTVGLVSGALLVVGVLLLRRRRAH